MKPNLLCIVPPYPTNVPPPGAAALLAYLKANGCHDFDFLDLRLWVPYSYAPTYSAMGAFGESFVMDVPDLPLVLRILRNFDEGKPLIGPADEVFERYCRERDITVEFLSSYLASLDRFFERAFGALGELEFVGFSAWTSNFLSTLLAAAHLKRRKKPPFILVGGPQVTESRNSAALGLRAGLFDSVCLGEGEEALLSLYRDFRLGGGRLSRTAPGTMRIDPASGELQTAERKLLRLESLPLPAFEEMPIASYRSPGRKRALPYQLSRGCTDKCSFCSEWVFWERFRSDTADHVLPQVEELVGRFGMEDINFTDSLLNGSLPRLRAFAEGLLSRSVDVDWGGFMRAKIDPETAALVRRAGCSWAFIGIESLSDETLELMNKRRTQADDLEALSTLLSNGISVRAGVIPGFPGDSRARFLKTIDLLRDLQRKYPGLSLNVEPFIISPGQPIFANLARYGLEAKKWDPSLLGDVPERYAAIVDAIPCTVEGANQGLERFGQLKIAKYYSDDRQAGAFSYQATEEMTLRGLKLEPLEPGWMLGQLKTSTALVYSVIVSDEECRVLQNLGEGKEKRSGDRSRDTENQGMLEDDRFRAFFKDVERAHLIAPMRDVPRIGKFRYSPSFGPASRIRVSPFTIARLVGKGTRARLMLVDSLSGRKLTMNAAFAPIVLRMARTPQSLAQLERFVAKQKERFAFDEVRTTLETFRERGVLVACEDAPVESVPLREVSTPTTFATVTGPRLITLRRR